MKVLEVFPPGKFLRMFWGGGIKIRRKTAGQGACDWMIGKKWSIYKKKISIWMMEHN
jgi:hypothetical protein